MATKERMKAQRNIEAVRFRAEIDPAFRLPMRKGWAVRYLHHYKEVPVSNRCPDGKVPINDAFYTQEYDKAVAKKEELEKQGFTVYGINECVF